jgi:hypothetical protein
MKKTFIYLSFIIFLGWFPSLFAGEIYVSLQGNDKNPGTKEAPFNTLNRAIKQARDSYHSPAGIHKFLPQKARETTPRK